MNDTQTNSKTSSEETSSTTSSTQKVMAEVVESDKSNQSNSNSKSADSSKEINLKNIIKFLDIHLVQKAPSLPKNVKDFCFKYLPLLNKIMVWFLSIFSFFLIFVIIISPIYYILILAANVIQIIYSVLAMNSLDKNQYKGWEKYFVGVGISAIIKIVASLVTLDLSSAILTFIFSGLSFYVLFQIRSYYKVQV